MSPKIIDERHSKIDEGKRNSVNLKQTNIVSTYMNLPEAILAEHSKANTQKIVQWIGNDPQKIQKLIYILFNDEDRIKQRAAWVLSDVAKIHPALVQKYVPALVEKLKDARSHIAVKRHTYRMLQHLELPEVIHGDLMNNCFESLINPREALAVRAFAMSILARMAETYPEIGNEVKLIINDALQQEAAASFKSRAKKVLNQLAKIPA